LRRLQQAVALRIVALRRAGRRGFGRISPSRLWVWREAALSRAWLRRLLIALAACGVAAAGIVAVTGLLDKDPQVQARTSRTAEITGPAFRLHVPRSWTRSSAQPRLPGFTAANAVVLVDASRKTRLVAALLPPTSPTLLPQAFVERLHDVPPKPERVSLGGRLIAYYYGGLSLVDVPGAHDVYVTPTSVGVATVVCSGDTRLGAPLEECWRAANSFALTQGRPVRLDQASAFRMRLDPEIRSVDATRERARVQLTRATTKEAQVAAAREVSTAYGRAADVLASLAQGPMPTAIMAQLRTNATTYRRIATDLEAQDGAALASHRGLALAGETHLKDLLTEVH
jgi:hypothetical protein